MGKASESIIDKVGINSNPTDFTFAEIDYLILLGYLDKESENKFGISYVSKSTNQGFGSYSVSKKENGEIEYNSSTPTNVDPDDGSYENSRDSRTYKNFDEFRNATGNRQPYKGWIGD